MTPIPIFKGHGTENDFIVVVDADDRLEWLGPDLTVSLCDRRAGVGADGLIRAVRTSGGQWFMDHWNADGGAALMCGNGIRVMAEVLYRSGLVAGDQLDILTRSGPRPVQRRAGGEWAVDMGRLVVGVPDGSELDAVPGDDQIDTLVATAGLGDAPRSGMHVDVGNPHVVVALTGVDEMAALDLSVAPRLLPDPPDGVNVEFVAVTGYGAGDGGVGELAMRVYERGVGETRSCGTGAVAAAAAAADWAGPGAPRSWTVDVRGGRLLVELGAGSRATLVGPATVVATVELQADWVDHSRAQRRQLADLTRSTR